MQAVSDNDAQALEDSAEALRRFVEGLRDTIFELRLKEASGLSFVSPLENLLDLNRRMARGRYEIESVVEEGFPATLLGGTARSAPASFRSHLRTCTATPRPATSG